MQKSATTSSWGLRKAPRRSLLVVADLDTVTLFDDHRSAYCGGILPDNLIR